MTTWLGGGDPAGTVWTQALAVLLDCGAKGVVLTALATAFGAVAMRRASAAARHFLWALTLGALLALPVLSVAMPSFRLPILPHTVRFAGPSTRLTSVAHAPASPAASPAAAPATGASAMPRPAHPGTGGADFDEAEWLSGGTPALSTGWCASIVLVWLAGALAVLAPLVGGLLAARQLVRGAAPHEGMGGAGADVQRVLVTAAGTMPMAVGLWRRIVLLPREAVEWSEERRRAVLLHELAHVRRRDCLTHAVGRAAVALHWCNPLAWLALRRLRVERERACDDLVLLAGERPSTYAEHLLAVARSTRARGLASAAAVTMAQPAQIEGRVRAVLDPKRKRRVLRWTAIVVGVLLVLAIAVPLAMLKFGEARVFSQMTPEQRAAFERWYTQKAVIPPEAVEPKSPAPEAVAAVAEFRRVWHEHQEVARAVAGEWARASSGPTTAEGAAEWREKLRPLEPLLAAFRAVVQRPGYALSDWVVAQDAAQADDVNRIRILQGGLDFVPPSILMRLCRAEAVVCQREGRRAEALAAADDQVAAAQMGPFDEMLPKMLGIAILKNGLRTYRDLAQEATDPAERAAMRAKLAAHRAAICYELPEGMDVVLAENVAMTAGPRRLGVEADLRNKTGYEVMIESNWVRLDCLKRNGALPEAADPKIRLAVEAQIQSMRALRARGELGTTRRSGPLGYLSAWREEIAAATLYSMALPGYEKAREHAMETLKECDDLVQSLAPEGGAAAGTAVSTDPGE